MNCTDVLRARVPESVRTRVRTAAERELLTESAWLKRLVIRELLTTEENESAPEGRSEVNCRSGRRMEMSSCRGRPVYVRLRPDDRALLEARAQNRGMRAATYLSVLTRGHLRQLAPLPKDELATLKRSIGELASIGRNLNQLAKASNEGRAPTSVRDEFRAMLKICEALRDNTKALIKANVTSWATGYEEADH